MIDPLYRPRVELPADVAVLARGAAAVRVTDTDPGSLEAQWMADRTVELVVRDDIETTVFAALLPEFLAHAASLADRPTEAGFALPSRDVDRARVARAAGFAPTSILGVADLTRRAPALDGASGLVVRPAGVDDTDAIVRLWWEQADYEARVGTLRTNDTIRAAIAARVPAAIAGAGWSLVAECEGSVLGVVLADEAADSTWAGTRLTVAPVSYLALASTTSTARGGGVGGALVRDLHARERAAGLAASVLHYSAFNPLSVPFWSQQGYRPVITFFGRRLGS